MLELEHWAAVPDRCGQEEPGVGRHNPRVMDLSGRATTEDQARIEEALEDLLQPQHRVLHVGVGNSSLALRFHMRVKEIVGITLAEPELEHATSLALPGYRVELINKYGPAMSTLPGPFDIIVDNNPASFCCCIQHFQDMLAAYVRLLRPDGLMVTDREGMYWCYDNGPMRLRFSDLEAIARRYPFAAVKLTSSVFALRRLAA